MASAFDMPIVTEATFGGNGQGCAKRDEATGPRETISLQPRPLRSHVSYKQIGNRTVTAIARVWRPGDAGRCMLCPAGQCCAVKDVCLIQVEEHVPSDSAGMFSSVGRPRDDVRPGPAVLYHERPRDGA